MADIFRYEHGANGKPAAHPIQDAHAGLAAFLTEEASWPDYLDILEDLIADAARTGHSRTHTGNAWAVHVGGGTAAIQHLHRPAAPRDTVPLPVFTQALREWRAFLTRSAGKP